jgi:hypothetical protein
VLPLEAILSTPSFSREMESLGMLRVRFGCAGRGEELSSGVSGFLGAFLVMRISLGIVS